MSDPLVTRESFVFNWDTPRARNLALIGFLVLSFALHAAGFYVFQIAYPPALSLPPHAARLTLITPSSEEGLSILRWVEAEDPAIASSTLRPAAIKAVTLPVVQHIPSYSIAEPALKHLPPWQANLRIPSLQPLGPVTVPRARSPEKTVSLPTIISFSQEVQELGNPVCPVAKFAASTAEAPQAISFRIAVGPGGVVLYCFAEGSSGDSQLDEQARRYLALCRFPRRSPALGDARSAAGANGGDLVWGTATVEWGNDIHPLQPKPTTPSPL